MEHEKKPYRKHNPGVRKAWEDSQAHLQIRIPKPLAEKMRAQAKVESLPFATWVRQVCLREVRRAKRAA